MPTSAGTSPTEVKVEIDTGLSDADINDLLAVVERDIDREYDSSSGVTFADTQHRIDFEAVLAALRIATGNAPDAQDRMASKTQTGRSSRTYETGVVATLRQRVQQRDPGDAFGQSGTLTRDSDRHISTTTDDT